MSDQGNISYNWRTVIVVPHKNVFEKIKEMCIKLQEEKKNFTYFSPNKTRGKGPQYQVWIYSINKQQAYERGDYFHQKFGVRYYVNPRR
ncbi:MAG: hypothetical protein HWN67_08375 [Candidatus Helarchaeota archaeon]|nr:hypothetical protein [Candidatus Helarchaeota archaeon]